MRSVNFANLDRKWRLTIPDKFGRPSAQWRMIVALFGVLNSFAR